MSYLLDTNTCIGHFGKDNQVLHLDAALVRQQPSVAVERLREAIAAAQLR